MLTPGIQPGHGVATVPTNAGTIWSGSATVPARWLGMHADYWPHSRNGVISAAPTYDYHIHRTHDYRPTGDGGTQWRHIQRVNSATFDWSEADFLLDTVSAQGRDIFWQVYGTPTWAAKPAFAGILDQFNYAGGASPPNVLQNLVDFVSTLVARYVARGTPIKYIGMWNEARYLQDNTGYWYGSAAEMAAQCKAVRAAAKAVDPNIIVLSPSFNNLASIVPYLAASDGAGGTGKDHIDGLAYHPYLMSCPPYLGNIAGSPGFVTDAVVDRMVLGGLASNFPRYADELAVSSTPLDPLLAGKHGEANMIRWLKRVSPWMLARGWKILNYYTHDAAYLGDPSTSAAISAALGDLAAQLSGQTLTRIDVDSDGVFSVYAGSTLLYSV